ncbi:MAG: hypothetical protein M1829_003386 [Trizodia sp. TS-e1964]|nr:MAG: hypothetical protein M1829_003386 [Trizodia sp. TS-e1964]
MAAFKTLSAKSAASLDIELMSTGAGAFTLDQLMELAGLSVSQAVYRIHPPAKGPKILVACGPGNNAGGDGLVAARHLWHYGYQPTVYYPKQGRNEFYQRLTTQLKNLDIPFTQDFPTALRDSHHVIDAIFGNPTPPPSTLGRSETRRAGETFCRFFLMRSAGFSFSGEIREPFPAIIAALATSPVPVTSVDVPSAWDVETGPPPKGPAKEFQPTALVSLTAPKPCVRWLQGRHFLGGRFVGKHIADKYGLEVPQYEGIDQVVELYSDAGKL